MRCSSICYRTMTITGTKTDAKVEAVTPRGEPEGADLASEEALMLHLTKLLEAQKAMVNQQNDLEGQMQTLQKQLKTCADEMQDLVLTLKVIRSRSRVDKRKAARSTDQ